MKQISVMNLRENQILAGASMGYVVGGEKKTQHTGDSKPMYNKLIWQFHEILKNRTVREFSCAAGRTYHTVLSDGTMFSCAHLMNEEKCKIGNLREWPLKDMERYGFIPVRISTIEECRDCWAQQLCHGGCASQKYSMGKTARQSYLPEKCELDKIMYEFLIKIYYELNQIS